MKEQTKRSSPKYTLEFKQDAANLVDKKGHAHQQAADNLGISLSAIGRWSRAGRGPATAIHHQDGSLEFNGSSSIAAAT